MKILIVDDEKQFTDDLAAYLTSLGYEAYSTYTGEQALGLLKKQRPDVLMCDLKLSGIGMLNGDDVLTRIKSLSPKTIPVVITAYRDEATQKKLTSTGTIKFIFKPIRLDEVASLLKEMEEKKPTDKYF